MKTAYVYIRPSPYLGGWWIQQRGLGSSYGLLPMGEFNTKHNALTDDFHPIKPFATEEEAWQAARLLAEREASRRNVTLQEGWYQGTFGTWRAWVVRHD